jgi:phosphoglycolate phosphatase-like HAD superfamily hydrolase
MLISAAEDLGIDLKSSWMVGDGLVDIRAGRTAECRTILVGRIKMEHLHRFFADELLCPDFWAHDLAQTLRIVREFKGCGTRKGGDVNPECWVRSV